MEKQPDISDATLNEGPDAVRARSDNAQKYKSKKANGKTGGRIIPIIAFDEIKLGRNRRDLVRGLIPRTGIVVVWGPPKSGKSFWTFDLTMHIPLGWDYRGRKTEKGAVVYCAFEGQAGIEARVEAFRQKYGPQGDRIASRLEVVTVGADEDGQAINSCVVIPVEIDDSANIPEQRLTKNQKTMFSILHDAGERGLTLEAWNERAREAGIGVNRKADLFDLRTALMTKQLIQPTANGWRVRHG